ncbi:unnamed protein product [Fusarium equiseti]|uniref:Helicase ATP-binding domain-containing protein n=1 Tax=Fusarium equiseti TaxID=61235 RepID=A0A8J2NHI6_FUSEQ|nr:unnamed protein product [Fusarium equiseti]
MEVTSDPKEGMSSLDPNTVTPQDSTCVKMENDTEKDTALSEVTSHQDTKMGGTQEIICSDSTQEPSTTTMEVPATIQEPNEDSCDSQSTLSAAHGGASQTSTAQVKQEDIDSSTDTSTTPRKMKVEITAADFQEEVVLEADSEDEGDPKVDNDDKDDADCDPKDDSDNDSFDDDCLSNDSDAEDDVKKPNVQDTASKKESLENEQNRLLVKTLKGEKLDDKECQRLKELQQEIANIQDPEEKIADPKQAPLVQPKAKRFLAKTAREYWQHVQEKEAEKDEKKRKVNESPDKPNKSQKTGAESHPGGILSTLETSQVGGDEDSSAPAMDEIKADSHEAQFKQIMAGIPKEFDTRRTATQKRDVKSAPKSFGYRKVRAKDGKWILKGMSTPMFSYQLIASSWMIMREAKGLHPSGGLLADDMGLGKTITCISVIVGHPPDKEDIQEFCKATLIIADSPQAAKQWYNQICEHSGSPTTKSAKSALPNWTEIYHKNAKGQAKKKDKQFWERRKVVIATYRDLLSQFPSKNEYKELKGQWAGDEGGFMGALRRKLGALFRIRWYRIILDEAHAIKRHDSSTTRACWELRAKYRWVVSGTPLSNSISEFYPYLRFIGSHFSYDRASFRKQYEKSDQAVQNFEALVSMIMYRRKQDDKFLGHTLVPLPKAHTHDLWVPLSTWESILNKVVDDKYKADLSDNEEAEDEESAADQVPDDDDEDEDEDVPNVNEEPPKDDEDVKMEEDLPTMVDAQTAFAIQTARCLRLRQLSSHVFNFEQFLRESDREQEVQSSLDKLRAEVSQSTNDDDQEKLHTAILPEYAQGLKLLEAKVGNMFGGSDDMIKMVELVSNENKLKDITCGLCSKRNPPVEPTEGLNCEHIYCESCLMSSIRSYNLMRKKGTKPHPLECPHPECSAELDLGIAVTTLDCIEKAIKALKGFRESGQDSIGTRWSGNPQQHTSFFHATCGRPDIYYDPVKMPLGTKVKSTASVILTWQHEAPDDKIIVFIEWTRTAKALGCVLEALGINFVYYNQMATNKKKCMALEKFKEDPNCKVLTKETYLVRILALGSIDERVYELQKAKEAIVAAALQDDQHVPHFSGEMQLRMLFSTKGSGSLVQDMKREMEERKLQEAMGK